MNKFDQYIAKISEALQRDLPGREAQFLMEPFTRKVEMKKQKNKVNAKSSSVLILLYEKHGALYTCMIKRPKYDGVHSGQIAFPGGQREESDKNLIETALRESFEEVGIIRENVNIIGQLSELYIPPSNFNVLPVIGFSKTIPDFVIDKTEVDSVLEIRLNDFLDSRKILHKKITSRNNVQLDVICYYIQNEIIWGASAMIISELVEILKEINPESQSRK